MFRNLFIVVDEIGVKVAIAGVGNGRNLNAKLRLDVAPNSARSFLPLKLEPPAQLPPNDCCLNQLKAAILHP